MNAISSLARSVTTGLELHDEFFNNFTSLHTRKNYRQDIEQFLSFLNEMQYQFSHYHQIERKHIINFRNWLQETGGREGDPCAPKTVARKLAALSSYFDFLVERNYCQFNPVTSVKRPRREVLSPTQALSREQVTELFLSIETHNLSGILHRALLVTFFTTGLRKSEILNLKLKNYRQINANHFLEYKGKGGKLGQKLLHPQCVEAIDAYIEAMIHQGRAIAPEDWLFQPTRNPKDPQHLNKPLNPKTINEILAHYAQKIGLNFNVSPHSARATFISELLNQGVDIYCVAQEVNHSSVKTTQEYDKRRRQLQDSPILKLKY